MPWKEQRRTKYAVLETYTSLATRDVIRTRSFSNQSTWSHPSNVVNDCLFQGVELVGMDVYVRLVTQQQFPPIGPRLFCTIVIFDVYTK